MCDNASVRAPAICVVCVDAISPSVVLSNNSRREARISCSTTAKGLYLFAFSILERASLMSVSSDAFVEGGRGYRKSARWV